ncbi:uncharacterized protein [Littorina saxatilis]
MPSAVKDIPSSLHLRDTNGNTLHFGTGISDLDTGSKGLKVREGNMDKKEEYDLEDNFDRLLKIDGDVDNQELEELGPGVKRTNSQNAPDNANDQTAKRRTIASNRPEVRPPPTLNNQITLRFDGQVPGADNWINTMQHKPVSAPAVRFEGSFTNFNCAPPKGSDLSPQVESDGAPSEEKERDIQAIMKDLLDSSPGGISLVGSPVIGGTGASFPPENLSSFSSSQVVQFRTTLSKPGPSFTHGPPQMNEFKLRPTGPPVSHACQTGQSPQRGPEKLGGPPATKQQTAQGNVTGPPNTGLWHMPPRGPPIDNQELSPLSQHSRDSGLSGSNSSISSNCSEKNSNSSVLPEPHKLQFSVPLEGKTYGSDFSPGVLSPPGNNPMHRSNSSESQDSGNCLLEGSPASSTGARFPPGQLSPGMMSPQVGTGVSQCPSTPESDQQSFSSTCQSPEWPSASPRSATQNGSPLTYTLVTSPGRNSGSLQQQALSSWGQVRSPPEHGPVSPPFTPQGVECFSNMPQIRSASPIQSPPRNPPFSPPFPQQARSTPAMFHGGISSPAQERMFSPVQHHSHPFPQGQSLSAQDGFTSPEQQITPAQNRSPSGQMSFSPQQSGSHMQSAHCQNSSQMNRQMSAQSHHSLQPSSINFSPVQNSIMNHNGLEGFQPSSLPLQISRQIHPSPQQNSFPSQSSVHNHCSTRDNVEHMVESESDCYESSDPEMANRGPGSGAGSRTGSPEEFSQNSPLPCDVLDAVCDERGQWVTDEYGDTFLHALSAWKNEETAVRNLRLVKDKSLFHIAINNYNKNLEVPLYNAVLFGKIRLVEEFLRLGADVNKLCGIMNLHTCLHLAVEQGNMKMVDTLLGCHHINVDARRTSDRCTPLMTAMMKHVPSHPKDDCLDIIRLMVERDEKPDFTVTDTRSGKTLMMFAVGTKDVRVLDLILQAVEKDEARRLINMTSRVGNSAVHMAAGFRADGHEKDSRVKEQMLRKLIMAGGETNRKNNEGFTPNDWARNMIEKVAKLK